jgi:hypothetical protein
MWPMIGSMAERRRSGEVANEKFGQRMVGVLLLLGGCITLLAFAVRRGFALRTFISIRRLRLRPLLGLGSRLFVARTNEPSLDPKAAIVIEDHEGAAARDIVAIVGLPFGLEQIDLGFQLAEPDIHVVGDFVRGPMPFGQLVNLVPRHLPRCPILRRQLILTRVRMPSVIGLTVHLLTRPQWLRRISALGSAGGAMEFFCGHDVGMDETEFAWWTTRAR